MFSKKKGASWTYDTPSFSYSLLTDCISMGLFLDDFLAVLGLLHCRFGPVLYIDLHKTWLICLKFCLLY